MRGVDTRPGLPDQLFEAALAQVAEDNPRRFVRYGRELLFHLRINVAGYPEDVGASAVIQIDQSSPPTHKAGFDAEPGTNGHIPKSPVADVFVKSRRVVAEVRFEDIQIAVQI